MAEIVSSKLSRKVIDKRQCNAPKEAQQNIVASNVKRTSPRPKK
jgi:hypothetical protein